MNVNILSLNTTYSFQVTVNNWGVEIVQVLKSKSDIKNLKLLSK